MAQGRCRICGRESGAASTCARCDDLASQCATIDLESGVTTPDEPAFDPRTAPALAERYACGEVLGTGAFATVYEARCLRTGGFVALKVHSERQGSKRSARFAREIEVLARLDHPNIVRVLDWGEVDGRPFLVMELLPRGTLKDLLKRCPGRRLTPGQAIHVMNDVLAGLAACHAQAIVHRDLKPANILFSAVGAAKLADLGLAKDLNFTGAKLTAANAKPGTPKYMSPEQFLGRPLGPASDIYSAGVVLFEMLVGQPPFHTGTSHLIAYAHVQLAPPLAELATHVGEDLVAVLACALAKPVDQRFADVHQFRQALARCRT